MKPLDCSPDGMWHELGGLRRSVRRWRASIGKRTALTLLLVIALTALILCWTWSVFPGSMANDGEQTLSATFPSTSTASFTSWWPWHKDPGLTNPTKPSSPGPSSSSNPPANATQCPSPLAGDTPHTLGPDDLNPISLPADVYPIERGICGGWVQAYVQLHSDILTGKLPPHYAIMMSESSGLGDRLTSSIAIALYAILTKRAFLYDWRGKHNLWNAYRSSYVDWRYKGQDKALGSSQVLHMRMYDHSWWPGVDSGQHNQLTDLFWHQDLLTLGHNCSAVVWSSNRGVAVRSFSNPWLKERLRHMGLSPATGFGCIFDLLFRPTPQVLSLFSCTLQAMLDREALKVGIQVRAGDPGLLDPSRQPDHKSFPQFFSCAEHVERQLVQDTPKRRVYWYLISDSVQVRRSALASFGSKLVTSMDVVVEHIQDDAQHGDLGLMVAAGEAWIFGLANVHIMSWDSSFGKLGAMVSCSWDSAYLVPSQLRFYESGRRVGKWCGKPASVMQLAEAWVGLRRSA